MRFVWAVAAFVVAALLIGAGIAQRTIFQGPGTQTTQVSVEGDTRYTMIDGAVFAALPGTQTLEVDGAGAVFVSYGRTADVRAWLSDQPHAEVTAGANGAIETTQVASETRTDSSDDGEASTGTPAERNPAGSDLWLGEFSSSAALTTPLQLPATMSVLVASDGTAPAPSDISISWSVPRTTPWAGPLIVLGGIVLAVGVVLYALGIRHSRRSRGPRRKAPPPLPETQPIDLAVEGASKGVITATPGTRSSTRRRSFVVVPAMLAGSLLFAGCSADAWPRLDATPTPSASPTVVDVEDQQPPAVTEAQAGQILERISQTVAQADTDLNADLAATRLDGAALAERRTNYTLRSKFSDYAAIPAIPAGSLPIVLPQAFDGWPRTVLGVVQSGEGGATTSKLIMMTQADPWANYKLVYTGDLGASTELPGLAPSYIGAAQVPPDSSFLTIAPDELAAAYADVLDKGSSSTHAALFDEAGDEFAQKVASDRQSRLDQFNQTATNTATLTFGASAGSQAPLALSTLESGAIVAVTVHETDTVTPANSDVVIKLDGNREVQALTGVTESATGVSSTFADQLFFYVPAQGSTDKIRVLGSTSHIIDAKVL